MERTLALSLINPVKIKNYQIKDISAISQYLACPFDALPDREITENPHNQ